MYYDTDSDTKQFIPKKYCHCVDNNGKPKKNNFYKEWGSKDDEEKCMFCGHVSWRSYLKRQIGSKKERRS